MSIHAYSPLDYEAAKLAIKESCPENVILSSDGGGLITVNRQNFNFRIDAIIPFDADYREGVRSKVSIYGLNPFERERKVQEAMEIDEEVATVMNLITKALEAIEVLHG